MERPDEKPPPPPRTNQEAKGRLSKLGQIALGVLRDKRPKMYQELAGREQLYLWAWKQQRQATEKLRAMLDSGAKYHEALDQVMSELPDLPPED